MNYNELRHELEGLLESPEEQLPESEGWHTAHAWSVIWKCSPTKANRLLLAAQKHGKMERGMGTRRGRQWEVYRVKEAWNDLPEDEAVSPMRSDAPSGTVLPESSL